MTKATPGPWTAMIGDYAGAQWYITHPHHRKMIRAGIAKAKGEDG